MIKITIQEVAEKYDLSKDTLRYYEKEGLVGPIGKNKSGSREYQEADLERIEFVKCMRSAGLAIAILKDYIKLYEEGEQTKEARLKLLEKERELLKEKIDYMEDAYKKLNYKIKLYKENMI